MSREATTVDESFWKNSPSPEPEDEKGEEGKEWGFEVVGEEVDNRGEVRYEIQWDNWQHIDGTSQTWHRMPPYYLRDWQRKQKRRRDELVQDSIDVELIPLSGTDIHNIETRLRAQAYTEKLETRRKYDPKLEEQMAELLVDKLGPGWDSKELGVSSASAAQASPAHTARGLRLSTVRQQQKSNSRQPEAGRKSTSKSPSIPDPTVPGSRSVPRSSKPLPTRQGIAQPQPQPQPQLSSPSMLIRKRKMSEVEGTGSGSGSSRNNDDHLRPVGKGKTPMHSLRRRLQMSMQWSQLARSVGAAPISFVNEEDDEETPPLAPDFQYLEKGYIYPDGVEQPNAAFKVGCDCVQCISPSNCDCQSVSEVVNERGHKIFAYNRSGLFSFNTPRGVEVIECNEVCNCDLACSNRVAQRPRDVPLQVFKTKRKGWGVRATIDIDRGKVLGIYSGRLVTRDEALKMNNITGGYVFDLDGQENLEGRDEEDGPEGKFSVDSRTCGNWTRFVNHSCNPNMMIYLVVYDTIPATNRPYIAFVARKTIEAGVELTVDYDPVSADLQDSERPSNKDAKGMKKCVCGSKKCRGYVQMC